MTDLHCHILPGIDDGAKSASDAAALLRLEVANSITSIAFTPHFNPEHQSVPEFCARREAALCTLHSTLRTEFPALSCKLGAEVAFSPRLLDLELGPLCYEGTPYLLIELPMSYYPQWAKDVFYRLGLAGYFPVLAHVERYRYFREQPELLYDLVSAGALTQVNAASFLGDKKLQQLMLQLVRWELVHVVATDAHSMGKRPPRLREAMLLLRDEFGAQVPNRLARNADELFAGYELDVPTPTKPRAFLGLHF